MLSESGRLRATFPAIAAGVLFFAAGFATPIQETPLSEKPPNVIALIPSVRQCDLHSKGLFRSGGKDSGSTAIAPRGVDGWRP